MKDFIDSVMDGSNAKSDLKLVGVYLEPDVADMLDKLGKKAGRGAKSAIANEALKKMFHAKELM